MGTAVADFFNIIGDGVTPPTNMVELIPYLLTVFCGIVSVVLVFKVIVAVASSISNWRRF